MESVKSAVSDIMRDAPSEMEELKELYRQDKEKAILDVIASSNAEVSEEGMEELPCDKCHGKGFIDVYDPERVWWKQEECECMKSRRALRFVKSLGLLKDVQKCNFDSYIPYDEPTTEMKKTAMNYKDGWLYLGGQSGAGKTHLAYSVFGRLVKRHKAPRWMRWIEDSQDIKMLIGDEEEFYRAVEPLAKAEILFIDDFFNITPTPADIRLARTIIDNRYSNDLQTIITSELTLAELDEIDDAIAGRIAEKATVFQISGNNHNYRMRNFR